MERGESGQGLFAAEDMAGPGSRSCEKVAIAIHQESKQCIVSVAAVAAEDEEQRRSICGIGRRTRPGSSARCTAKKAIAENIHAATESWESKVLGMAISQPGGRRRRIHRVGLPRLRLSCPGRQRGCKDETGREEAEAEAVRGESIAEGSIEDSEERRSPGDCR